MGLQIHGYPNLFTTATPLAPSAALCNMTTCLRQQAEWISECIRHMRANDKRICELRADVPRLVATEPFDAQLDAVRASLEAVRRLAEFGPSSAGEWGTTPS